MTSDARYGICDADVEFKDGQRAAVVRKSKFDHNEHDVRS